MGSVGLHLREGFPSRWWSGKAIAEEMVSEGGVEEGVEGAVCSEGDGGGGFEEQGGLAARGSFDEDVPEGADSLGEEQGGRIKVEEDFFEDIGDVKDAMWLSHFVLELERCYEGFVVFDVEVGGEGEIESWRCHHDDGEVGCFA